MKLQLLTLTLLFAAVFADLTWSNCGTPEDLMELESMTFEPEVPKRGEMLKVYAKGSLKQSIGSGSKVSVFVKWGLIRVPVPPVDMCKKLDEFPDSEFHCPLQPGPFTVTQSFQLPADIPDGKFDVNLKIRDQDKRQVSCFQIKLSF